VTHPEIERDKDIGDLEWLVRRLRGHQERAITRGEESLARRIQRALKELDSPEHPWRSKAVPPRRDP
jgi:hypothetical protein